MSLHCRHRALAGMTLIEVLVSIAISTILIMAGYAVYAAATDGWNTSRRRMDMQQRARVSLDMMGKCIRAAEVTDDQDSFVFEGENVEVDAVQTETEFSASLPAQDLLALRTNAPLYLPGDKEAPDQTKVQFFLEVPQPDTEDAATQPLSLKMKIDANFDQDTTESGYILEIAEGVDSLNFRYFNGTTWEDQWSSSQGAPHAVEVTIVVRDLDEKVAPQAFAITAPVECWRELSLKTVSAPSSTSQPDGLFHGSQPEGPPQPPYNADGTTANSGRTRGSNSPAGTRVRP